MARDGPRSEADAESGADEAEAEVHVFKPYRPVGLLKALDCFKRVATEAQKSARRLFHFDFLVDGKVEAAVTTIYRIGRPEPIQTQHFENQGGGGRKPAKLEAELGLVAVVEQDPAGGAIASGVYQGVQAGLDMAVGIQDENVIRGQKTDSSIHAARETEVFRAGFDGDSGVSRDAFESLIGRGIVDD
jgi:hypothetical protein